MGGKVLSHRSLLLPAAVLLGGILTAVALTQTAAPVVPAMPDDVKPIRVADRFHLGLNLREAVERVVSKQSADLRKAAQEVSPRYQTEQMLRAEGLLQELPAPPKRHVTKPQSLAAQRREQRLARYEEAHRLAQAGLSISAIARQMGLHRETVRSFLRAETFPERVIPAGRPSSVAPFADYLRERWRAGCRSAKKL